MAFLLAVKILNKLRKQLKNPRELPEKGGLQSSLFFILILMSLLVSCVKKGGFLTPSCSQGNSNCDLPSMQVEVVGSEGGGQAQVDNNGDVGTVVLKSVRYGERSRLEFILQNPKIIPLQKMSFAIVPGDTAAFSLVASPAGKDCRDEGLLLLYKQKCSVTIEFAPGKVPPPLQALTFTFQTLLGDTFIFRSKFDPAKLLSDFYLSEADLTMPEAPVVANGVTSSVGKDILIENNGTESDLSNIQFFINGSTEWSIDTPTATPSCSQGGTISKGGSSCYIRVNFAPNSPGLKNASLVMVSGDQVSREFPLLGTGRGLEANINVVDFGAAVINSSSPPNKSITLTFPEVDGVQSAKDCTFDDSTDLVGTGFAVASNTCTTEMGEGSTCQVTVQWTPSATAKEHIGEFSWSCSERGGAGRVQLMARSSESPLVSEILELDFGEVLEGSHKSLSLALKNDGRNIGDGVGIGTLIDLKRAVKGDTFSELTSTCTDKLPVGANCATTIKFAPNSSGLQFGSFEATAAQTEMDYKVALQGQAIKVIPSSELVDFGTVTPNSDRPGSMVYIRNPSSTETASGCELLYSDILSQNFSLDSSSTCLSKTELAPHETCSVRARFTALNILGDRNSALQFRCGVGGSAEVRLKGTIGNETRLMVAPPSNHYLLDHLVGTTNHLEFLVLNGHSTETATDLSIVPTGLANGWSVVSSSGANCSTVNQLTPGQSCRVRMQSSPSASPGGEELGPHSGTLAVSANGGNIDPPDGTFGSLNKKLTSSYQAGYDFGTLDINETVLSEPISLYNPSSIDYASGCIGPTLTSTTPGAFSIESTSCSPSGLSPLSSCRVVVAFNGSATDANIEEFLDYECSVGGRVRTSLNVAVVPKLRYLWSGNGNFGFLDLNQPAVERTFTFTNNEASTMEIISLSLANSSAFTILASGTTCAAETQLTQGQSCSVKVAFGPSGEVSYSSKLIIAGRPLGSSAPTENYSKNLFGAGSSMALALSQDSITFDDQLAVSSMSESKLVTVTNNGSRPTTLSISNLVAPFSVGNGGTCGAVLVEGQSCTVQVKMTASATGVGLYSGVLAVSDQESANAVTSSTTLSGRILAAPILVIKDNITDSAATTLATTDITGPVGNARNIVDHSASKTVTYTVTSSVPGSGSVVLGNVGMIHTSGQDQTMSVSASGNTCNGKTLAANESCSFSVVYEPTQDHETSKYSLSLSGLDIAGDSVMTSVTEVIGNSYKSATLAFSPASLDFSTIEKGVAATEQEVTITNSGDYTADLGSLTFSGSGGSDYSRSAGTTGTNCGSTIAAGATCYTKIGITASTVLGYQNTGTLSYTYTVGSSQPSKSAVLGATALSYLRLSANGVGSSYYAEEGEIASDENRVYIATRFSDFTSYSMPVITICERHADGFISADTSLCTQNLLKGSTHNNLLVGTLNGSGPKIAVSGNYLILAVNNQDTYFDDNISDGVNSNTAGNSTFIVCKKPVGGRIIAFETDCAVVPIDFKGGTISTGAYPSMAIVGNKIALSNSISGTGDKGVIIHVCSFDNTHANSSGVIDKTSCKSATIDRGSAERAQMGTLDFQENQVVVAYYNHVSGEESLNAVSCDVASDNTITCGISTNVSSAVLDSPTSPVAPGAYPSIVIDNTKIYLAHQQGESNRRYLRLSDCSLSGAGNLTIGSCSTQTMATRSGSEGTGIYPRISKVGSGAGAKIWISYLGAAGESVFSSIYSGIRYCTLLASGSPTCEASAYFENKNLLTANVTFVSRGHYFDATKKMILIPQAVGNNKKVGILSIGIFSDLLPSP
jgi:hypothetical protein